jgi:FemAB-related protein (PEP-CTERM system-associated)
MRDAYGNVPCYLTATRGGKVVGILQLVEQKSALFGHYLCSLPYLDASGVLADDAAAQDSLMEAARRLLGERHVRWVELRQSASLGETVPSRRDKVAMCLDLPDNAETLWQGLKASVRNQVRKAQKAEMTAGTGGADAVEEFHRVYARTMRDLGSPPHGIGFFHEIAETFGEAVRFHSVRTRGLCVAASLTFAARHGVHVPWAAASWRYRQDCPNMLLYWSMLEDACRRGAKRFDFGRSTRDSGTYKFKKQWGAGEVPLYWHYLLAEGASLPELRPDSPKYRFLAACWKKLPVWMAKRIGPRIIAKLS